MPQNPLQITCSTAFTVGRDCPLTAVVLHEIKSGMEMFDAESCRCLRPRPLTSPACHASMHFAVGGNCLFHQYVQIADTAWGFYYIPTPVCPEPPCPIVQTCDGIGAEQYNPEEDGTLPTPDVAAGADLTANCSVIHVGVLTGAASTSSGIYCITSPQFSPNAYRCLVQSLCYIFEAAGLEPIGYTNLLTHIGELMELDLTQLATDIQACLDFVPPPLPPCDCAQTPLAIADSTSLNLSVSGTDNHTLTGNVILSPTAGNQVSAASDGLLVSTNDPVLSVGSGNLNVTTQVTAGKQIFLVDANGGAITLTTPPDAAGLRKEIWIKNVDAGTLTINSADLIDGQAAITLDGVVAAGYPFGNDGGEAVHLVWATALNTWYIV